MLHLYAALAEKERRLMGSGGRLIRNASSLPLRLRLAYHDRLEARGRFTLSCMARLSELKGAYHVSLDHHSHHLGDRIVGRL